MFVSRDRCQGYMFITHNNLNTIKVLYQYVRRSSKLYFRHRTKPLCRNEFPFLWIRGFHLLVTSRSSLLLSKLLPRCSSTYCMEEIHYEKKKEFNFLPHISLLKSTGTHNEVCSPQLSRLYWITAQAHMGYLKQCSLPC
jgi:hypothetical protein